jgi:selenocysteine lyase/cysteine desulfurase
LFYKDAVFLSPHKFPGGVGAPGVLIVKKRLLCNDIPTTPGGGTVFFVTEKDHRYLSNRVEREEGGTPDIVGSMRAGLAFWLKERVGSKTIEKLELDHATHALQRLAQSPHVCVLGPTDIQQTLRLPIVSFMIKCGSSKFLHYNYVSALLNDVFGIQSRGGCACAGPYGQKLLGLSFSNAQQFERALLNKHEFLRPGFCR